MKFLYIYSKTYGQYCFFPSQIGNDFAFIVQHGSYPPSIHCLLPIQINYLLPACMLPFYLDFAFLLLSCPLCSSGDGGTRHEEVPAKDCRAPLDHQETGGQKRTAGR